MKKIKGIVLFVISLITVPTFSLIGVIVSMIVFVCKKDWEGMNRHFEMMAISKDQHANVSTKHIFNALMIKTKKYVSVAVVEDAFGVDEVTARKIIEKASKFGQSPDVTISAVFGFNKVVGRLTIFGMFWSWFLHTTDKNHVEDAINSEIND